MTMKTRYTVVDGEVIAEKRSGVRKEYVPDPLGSTVALLDSTQTQTDTFTYWPYGEEVSHTGTTPASFRFVGTLGYYRDSSTKTYIRARELDTQKGRWLTEDPIGFDAADTNFYRYISNKPSTVCDPSGLGPCDPVVYNCSRPIVGPGGVNHAFFWIHYPCDTSKDSTIGFGPGGSYKGSPGGGEQKDDLDSINNGSASCDRTNCKKDCVISRGGKIRSKDPSWDPRDYNPLTNNCYGFVHYTLDECKCNSDSPSFRPHPKPKIKPHLPV